MHPEAVVAVYNTFVAYRDHPFLTPQPLFRAPSIGTCPVSSIDSTLSTVGHKAVPYAPSRSPQLGLAYTTPTRTALCRVHGSNLEELLRICPAYSLLGFESSH